MPANEVVIRLSATETCWVQLTTVSGTQIYQGDINPGGIGTITVPFDPGLVIPPNRSLCVKNWDTTNVQAEVFVYGFVIPSSAAPVGTASRNTPTVEHKQ